MKAYVTRDSVSAGDDVLAPHAREVRIHAEPTMRDLVDQALKISQLPRISGGKATWALSSSIPLAVVAQEWDEPELVSQFPLDLGLLDHSNARYVCTGHTSLNWIRILCLKFPVGFGCTRNSEDASSRVLFRLTSMKGLLSRRTKL